MPLIDVGWRNAEAIANPETEPCPTCGLGVTREPTVTVLRDGRTYHQTILRCPNARKYKAKAYNGSCFAKKNPCAVRKIEHEIKIETEIIDMARHANPVTRQSQEWIDNVSRRRSKLGLTRHALADLAGVPHSTFGKAIAANWGATAATVEAIECALATLEAAEHATAAELLAGETARPVPPEPMKDGSMFLPAGTEVKYCPGVGLSQPQPVDDTPHLSSRVSDLAEDQVRFWIELAEATKRLTKIESRLDADNSSHVDKGELSAVLTEMQTHTGNISNRQETQEYAINQLAKSVERIDRDEAANCEKIDNLREDLTAWAGIFDMLNGAIGKHKDQIALTRVVTEAHGERLTDLENSRAEWDEDHRRIGSALDECGKSIKALEGHPSGGESPLWDALDVLTTDVKELRSSYVNRPWGARIEETVEALAAEIRILHSTAATRSWAHETGETIRALELRLSCLANIVEARCSTRTDPDRQDNSLMLAYADIVRRLDALESTRQPGSRMDLLEQALEYQAREITRLKGRDDKFTLEVVALAMNGGRR